MAVHRWAISSARTSTASSVGKIDGLTTRAPWNDTLRALLAELYSEDDARLVAAMPWGFSRIGRLERVTGIPRAQLERQLASLCPRGLVMDVHVGGDYYYAPSPMVIGIFEFTMMRTGGTLPLRPLGTPVPRLSRRGQPATARTSATASRCR